MGIILGLVSGRLREEQSDVDLPLFEALIDEPPGGLGADAFVLGHEQVLKSPNGMRGRDVDERSSRGPERGLPALRVRLRPLRNRARRAADELADRGPAFAGGAGFHGAEQKQVRGWFSIVHGLLQAFGPVQRNAGKCRPKETKGWVTRGHDEKGGHRP
jgi:hypothetical protein